MRTLTYGAACSLDGYLAGPNEELDWLKWSPDVSRISRDFMSRVDTILMGRKTYEAGRRQGSGAQAGFRNFVFSRTVTDLADPNATLVDRDASEFVGELKAGAGAEICLMGGGELARSLFTAEVIDRVGVNIHPIILGRGIPLIPDLPRRINLQLLDVERIAEDCVYALYQVVRQ